MAKVFFCRVAEAPAMEASKNLGYCRFLALLSNSAAKSR